MRIRLTEAAKAELDSLKKIGVLPTADQILEQARSSNSALHLFFTWDDSEAANLFRMAQAATLARTYVRMVAPPPRAVTHVVVTNAVAAKPQVAQPVVVARSGEALEAFQLQALIHDVRQAIEKHKQVDAPRVIAMRRALETALTETQAFRAPTMSKPQLLPPSPSKAPAVVKPPASTWPKELKCMNCQTAFQSSGAGNRLCNLCRRLSSYEGISV